MSDITLGIIGSGQLGSLLCQAAKKLSVKTVVISDDEQGPAQSYSNEFIYLKYNDENKIKDATGVFSSAGPIAITRLEREKEMGIKSSESMEAEHPIVITVDGKKTLYVSPGHLMKIKNVKEDEAEYLKNYLVDQVNKEEFIFSYEWDKGDICLWDNLSILHMASEIKNCRRVMHRITIK